MDLNHIDIKFSGGFSEEQRQLCVQRQEVSQGGGAGFLCTPRVKPGLLPRSHGVLARHSVSVSMNPNIQGLASYFKAQWAVAVFSLVFEEQGIVKRRYNANLVSSNLLLFKIEQNIEFHPPICHLAPCGTSSALETSVNNLLLTCPSLALLPRVPGKEIPKETQAWEAGECTPALIPNPPPHPFFPLPTKINNNDVSRPLPHPLTSSPQEPKSRLKFSFGHGI